MREGGRSSGAPTAAPSPCTWWPDSWLLVSGRRATALLIAVRSRAGVAAAEGSPCRRGAPGVGVGVGVGVGAGAGVGVGWVQAQGVSPTL